jgi:hypothetical protein
VRQINTSGYTLAVPDLGQDVAPGEEVDHPELITGFEAVEDPPAKAKKTPAKPAEKTGDQDQEQK